MTNTIKIDKILILDEDNYRKEYSADSLADLADSFRSRNAKGKPWLIQAVTVTPLTADEKKKNKGKTHRLKIGFRRMRAAHIVLEKDKADWIKDVPVQIEEEESTAGSKLFDQLIENLQRENPNPIDCAHGLKALQDEEGISQKELADQIGKSPAWVAQRIRLLDLDVVCQQAIAAEDIAFSHARELHRLPKSQQAAVLTAFLSNEWTLGELKARIDQILKNAEAKKNQDKSTEEVIEEADQAVKEEKAKEEKAKTAASGDGADAPAAVDAVLTEEETEEKPLEPKDTTPHKLKRAADRLHEEVRDNLETFRQEADPMAKREALIEGVYFAGIVAALRTAAKSGGLLDIDTDALYDSFLEEFETYDVFNDQAAE